jgi:Ricin-type beta-trefoil lectin domain-like/Secretion system C-terminal sorting domain
MKKHFDSKKLTFRNILHCILLVIVTCLLPSKILAQSFNYDPYNAKVYKILNHRSQLALEIGGTQTTPNVPGSTANQWPYVGTANQQWLIKDVGYGLFNIINRGSGQTLEIGGGGGTNTKPGAKANQWPLINTAAQKWSVYNISGNNTGVTHKMICVISNQALEIGGSYTQTITPASRANQWTYLGTDNQLWDIIEIDPVNPVVIKTFNNIDKVALGTVSGTKAGAPNPTGSGGLNERGTIIAQAAYSSYTALFGYSRVEIGIANQQWIFNYLGNGYMAIINRGSGLALEIGTSYANTLAAGTVANQWEYTGEDNQQWREQYNADGSLTFFNRRSGLCLELGSDGYVRQYPYVAGAASQKWQVDSGSFLRGTSTPVVGIGDTKNNVLALASLVAKTSDMQPSSGLTVYPNPANDIVTVTLPVIKAETEPTSVQVTDAHGRVTTALYLGYGRLDVSSLTSGLYLVTVLTNHQRYYQKFVKE